MKNNLLEGMNAIYQSGDIKNWTGRKINPAKGNQYWYQAIEMQDASNVDKSNSNFALLGYCCEEGVRRNLGRVGAAHGPKAIREKLAKLAFHLDEKNIADYGDVICVEEDMESCQLAFSKIISHLIQQQIFPIGMGGGHDIAYAHFMGIWDAIKNTHKRKIGIVNFDAHFDLRPVEGKGNSGTPFNQILNEFESVQYFPIGIQKASNTKELLEIARKENIEYIDYFDCVHLDTCLHASTQTLQQKLNVFMEANDYIYISIDLDGFSSAYAMGVSAPSPLGFSPHFVFEILQKLFASNKVIACDIAELNPSFDADNLTANLAARLVDYIVSIQ